MENFENYFKIFEKNSEDFEKYFGHLQKVQVRHKSHKWTTKNRTKTGFNTSSESSSYVWILCDQLSYFLDWLLGRCCVQSSLPSFILNASHLFKLPYNLQNRRIWQPGHTIWEHSMKNLFHTMIRVHRIISFQHKNLFLR